MRLQILMSVMNQTHDILKQANIQSDAIIVNQCDEFKKEVFDHNGHTIQFLSFDERGVGRSRNAALMRADADIVLMADDDVKYIDGYADKILDVFSKHPEADMIVFNVPTDNPDRQSYEITKFGRVRKHNSLRYGTYRMAFRLDRIKQKNIYFSLLFGGGAKYSSGEDSLFIYSAIRSGLKVYKSPETIGTVDHATSTWFHGYTNKFFRDKGAFFRALSPWLYPLLILQLVIRRRLPLPDGISPIHALKQMFIGARLFGAKNEDIAQ